MYPYTTILSSYQNEACDWYIKKEYMINLETSKIKKPTNIKMFIIISSRAMWHDSRFLVWNNRSVILGLFYNFCNAARLKTCLL